MTRPSAACLDRLENQADMERVKRLSSQFDQFFIQASKHAIELKAYQKLIAESEKHARSDPNSQHWLNQIEEKSARQSQVQHAINQLVTQAVQQIDQHIRTEAISIIRALHSDGFFDKPGKNSNLNSNLSPTALKTIEKSIDNERKEREDSLATFKKEFEDYRTFNNTRFEELQASFQEFKESNQTRFKNLEDTHRQQMCSLRASLKLTNQQQTSSSPQPPVEQAEPQQLKQLIQEQVQEHLHTKHIPPTDLISKQSLQTAIKLIKEQLDNLGLQITETLKEFEPQIKQITQAIQLQVIKSTKTVISDGHKDIATLINGSIVKLQDQVDKLEPLINSSSERIDRIEADHLNLDSQINEKVHSKLESQLNEKVHPQIESQINQNLQSNLEDQINKKLDPKLAPLKKQLADLTQKQHEHDKKLNYPKALQSGMSKLETRQTNSYEKIGKLEKTITDVQSQFKDFELRIKPLQDRIEGVETTVQNSNHDHHNPSRRPSTPAYQANQPSHSHRRTSQTPPSPHSHSSSSNVNGRFPPSEIYNPTPTQSRRQSYQANRASTTSSSALAAQSQNISIASRLTNGPAQGGPVASSQTNGETTYYRKRTLSRESSISRPSQSNVAGSSHWPASTTNVGSGQSHNYATQPPSYEPQSDQSYSQFAHQQSQQPVSSIPLAKRLKNDYSLVNSSANHSSYHNNHDHQSEYHPFHTHSYQQQQQPYQHHHPAPNPYKKNFTYTKRS
ncbi:hypothetical protein PGT21_026186 [Puccinia graminis f. sp. tritici]|uniref:Uncharacterized protein n=1 Tax=Puccinia graminis f. sp. tritici TaxID=56615 RepID=A0A5B0QYP5_PUCGR|nr:hypothetical protein PGT21_026186 [Puccinia graminis f. sp. tritici]